MTGCLYGIGVGPGDPENMTLKAVRLIKECAVIAIPQEDKESCVSYRIARAAVPEIGEMECLCLSMPMTKDREVLKKSHQMAAEQLADRLKAGKNVAFLTLGDATVYSTYLYIHKRIQDMGYRTEIVSGITSFCAVAALLDMPLVNGSEELHIIPASYQIEEALRLKGVLVLMKAGRQMGKVKELLRQGSYDVRMVENCGMDGQRIFNRLEDIPDNPGYYSLIIVRDKGEKPW